MDASPSHTDINTALTQSGYLMEQQVATQLETLDLSRAARRCTAAAEQK